MKNMIDDFIDSSPSTIVVKETPVHLSDEKLRGLLARSYEKAQSDSSSESAGKWSRTLLSISGTLLLSLLTASFNSVGKLDASTVSTIAWFICVLTGLAGIVFSGINYRNRTQRSTSKRDAAVDEVFNQYVRNENVEAK